MGKYRSAFEAEIAEQLENAGVAFEYETVKLRYTVPEVTKTYRPDFRLPNGIFIEAKGYWRPADRLRMLRVLQSNPEIDLRMVFMKPYLPIYRNSKTTYAAWCDEHGIKWAEKAIPKAWLEEEEKQ